MNSGLTDQQKESLLKFFLTHCEVRKIDKDKNQINFFNSGDTVSDSFASIFVEGMRNLQSQSVPLIVKLMTGEL